MKTLKKNAVPLVVIIGLMIVVVTITAYAATSPGSQASGNLWLSNFLGDEVVVTFIVAPPGIERTVKGTLMDAEIPGIVLRLGNDEMFFSYANIICVEPSPS